MAKGLRHLVDEQLSLDFKLAPELDQVLAYATQIERLLVQLVSALWMWGRLHGAGSAPAWVTPVHRWSGTTAFVVSLGLSLVALFLVGAGVSLLTGRGVLLRARRPLRNGLARRESS